MTEKLLSKVLMDQYKGISEIKKVSDNIKSIEDVNTYTVTTGHQLNIFTGPLYVIYKIVSTIKLTQELNNTYPDKHYVPVYWMASEDHDFKEIQSFQAFGKNYTWDINPTGAVGKNRSQNPLRVYSMNYQKKFHFLRTHILRVRVFLRQ